MHQQSRAGVQAQALKGAPMRGKTDLISPAGMRNFFAVALFASVMWAAMIWAGFALL